MNSRHSRLLTSLMTVAVLGAAAGLASCASPTLPRIPPPDVEEPDPNDPDDNDFAPLGSFAPEADVATLG